MTEPSKIIIRKMAPKDLKQVAAIHRRQFPASRSTSLGAPFVRKMYQWFIENQPELSYVALLEDKIAGFVTGAIGGYGRTVFRYAIFEILLGLLTRPWLLLRGQTFTLWSSYLKGLFPRRAGKPKSESGPTQIKASLASIAVAQAAQGFGLGKALVAAFEEGAGKQGVCSLGLSVALDNQAARHLYERCGWQLQGENGPQNSAYYTKKLS
ncbi:GNAT family N-acetyltransferase [Chloroflexota bacterium]